MTARLATKLNALALYSISALLLGAFYFQIVLDELPCPLCLLQRVGFIALALGPVLTVRYGPRPSHYGLVLIAGLLGAVIATRQVLLHVAPDDPGFGSAILGYHFYTWALVCFLVAIAASAVMLLFDDQFDAKQQPPPVGLFEQVAVGLIIAMTLLNAASVLLECGFASCPSEPVQYELIHGSGASP